jgi:hypothetical protein
MGGLGGTAAEGLAAKPVSGLGGTAAEAKFRATGAELSAAELAVLEGVVPGTVAELKALIVDASRNLASLNNLTLSGTLSAFASLKRAGAAAAQVADRFGATVSEGYEVRVIDETLLALAAISTDLTEDVPSGAVILSVQANIETAVVAGGTSVKVGIGPVGDPDQYGLTADLAKNTKADLIPAHAVLAALEDIQINMVTAAGAIGDTAASAGAVRVRIVYAVPNSLDDAA